MKKNMTYAIVILIVIVVGISVILIINNKNSLNRQEEITNQSDTNVPSKSEAEKMTDDQLIQKTISGEENDNLDNVEEDKILNDIDTVLNEKDPLADMPGQ